MDWFRMYNEIVYDPKVIRLSDKEHRAWVNMLAIASMNGGVLPSVEDVALHLRTTEQRAASLLSKLCNRGFFDKGEHGVEPHNWKQRQYLSDSSTQRVQKYRERTRGAGCKVGEYQKHRDAVFARDGGACVYCGSFVNLCLDHMVPVLLGGDDNPMNLCVACKACNSGKAGRRPEQAGMRFVNSVTEKLYQENLKRLQQHPVTVPETPSEQNRAETEQKQSRAEGERATSNPLTEDGFTEFREVFSGYGLKASEQDWKEAHAFEWKRLDFHQKLAAVQGIRDRIEAGATNDPAASALPKNYLAKRMWDRAIRVDRPKGRDAVGEILGTTN